MQGPWSICREKCDGRSQGERGDAEAREVVEVLPQGLHSGDEARGLYDQSRKGREIESSVGKTEARAWVWNGGLLLN